MIGVATYKKKYKPQDIVDPRTPGRKPAYSPLNPCKTNHGTLVTHSGMTCTKYLEQKSLSSYCTYSS